MLATAFAKDVAVRVDPDEEALLPCPWHDRRTRAQRSAGRVLHLAAPNCIDSPELGGHDSVHYYKHERIKIGLQGLSPVEYRLRSTA